MLTVFFGILSAFLAIHKFDNPSNLAYLLLFLALLATWFFAAMFTLPLLGPDSFATIAISRRQESKILSLLALESEKLCTIFACATLPADPLITKLYEEICPKEETDKRSKGQHFQQKDVSEITTSIAKIWSPCNMEAAPVVQAQARVQRKLNRHEQRIRRLQAMINLASEELDIPRSRLTDHLLNFAPDMFRRGAMKYAQNCGEIQRKAPHLRSPADISRFIGLVRQNYLLTEDCRRKAESLRQLARLKWLHPYIYKLISVHSTSGTLQVYSEALSDIAASLLPLKRSKVGEAIEVLSFLHRKQFADPGSDVHSLLLKTCKDQAEDSNGEKRDLCILLAAIGSRDTNSLSAMRFSRLQKGLVALTTLPSRVDSHLAIAREGITDRFPVLYNHISRLAGKDSSIFVVTHGYSKTVREVLRACFGSQWPETSQRVPKKPYIFLAAGQESVEQFDTRLMKVELGEVLSAKDAPLISLGTAELLLGLLSEQDWVLIIEGAESFDSEGRVVQPRRTQQLVQGLHAELARRRISCNHVVVAEGYKRSERILLHAFSDHYDRLSVYKPWQVDAIVSNDGMWPSGWKARLRPRSRQTGWETV